MMITKLTLFGCAVLLSMQDQQTNTQPFPEAYAANVEMWWRQLPFIERIHAAADSGFEYIEFWPWLG